MFSGLVNPTVVRFASDGRVFVAEKSGLIKVFDNLTRHDADGLRRPAHQGPQLLGSRPARPGARTRTSRPMPYVYVLYTYDAAIGGTPPRWGTSGRHSDGCPTPPGATSDGCVVSGRLSRLAGDRQRDDRHRAGADRGLVPAVPEPLDRHARLRRRRRALRERRRRRELQLRRLRPGRLAAEPVRRSARRRRRRADAHRPRRAARSAARTSGRTRRPRGPRRHRSSASTRRPAPACPTTRSRLSSDRERRPHRRATASATRSASPSRPGTNELWIGDVGWNDWEEIDRRQEPAGPGRSRTSGGRATRARAARPATTAQTSTLCESLYAQPGGVVRHRSSRTTTPPRSCPARRARRAARRSPASRSRPAANYPGERTTARSSSPTTRGTASGDAHRRQRGPRSGDCLDVRSRSGQPGRSHRSGRTARSTTRISTGARSAGSRTAEAVTPLPRPFRSPLP